MVTKVLEAESASPTLAVRPHLKIIYLIVVAIAALAIRDPMINGGLFLAQLLPWLILGFGREERRVLKRAIPYALAILFFQAFFETPRDVVVASFQDYEVMASRSGFYEGAWMVVRFLTILCASAWVRRSMSSHEFVQGLVHLRLSKNLALVLDSLLGALEGKKGVEGGQGGGRGDGTGGGRRRKEGAASFSFKSLLRGDFSFLNRMVHARLEEARSRFVDHDWAVIAAISMVVVGIRLVQVLPGLPFAPGNKNLLLIPLYVLAASLSKKRFSAFYVGLLSGIVGFMFGQGKYGVLGILQFLVPGLVVDLTIGLTQISRSVLIYAIVGILAGLGRVSVEIFLALIFGLPGAFFAFITPFLIAQCCFGALSAPLSKYLVKNLESLDKGEERYE